MPAIAIDNRPETKEGVLLEDLPVGTVIEVQTKNRKYVIENEGNHQVWISGHPKYCPHPVLVTVLGSTWGGTTLKMHFIGPGMRLEYRHPTYGVVATSHIKEVRQIPPESPSQRQVLRPAC